MKLPALWLAGTFAAGIVAATAASLPPGVWGGAALIAIVAGLGCARREWLGAAWTLALAAWISLGGLAATFERIALPSDHISRLIEAGRVDPSEPLRWRGRLRSDPVRLPWGFRCEIDLDEVETGGQILRTSGGLRLSYFFPEDETGQIPGVRAGDRVEALLRARPPRNFMNPGAFDARAHLARQGVHVTGSLRSLELLRKIEDPPLAIAHRFARIRGHFLARLDALFARAPDQAAVLRAMLLGDYNFLDREVSQSFQKTSVYHVLVISGLHVAALAAFVWWLSRRLRLPLPFTVILILGVLGFFVAVVEDRPPIERAALMAAVLLAARLLFRRVETLNTVAVAALLVLAMKPSALTDASFQLSFLAAGIIGGLALPLLDATSAAYRRALEHVSDVTRDAALRPRVTQFRLDLRLAAGWLGERLPPRFSGWAASLVTAPCGAALRLWEVFVVSFTIQLGMAPVMAHFFHRVSLSGPLANMPAALLCALIVPIGFLALVLDAAWNWLGQITAPMAGWLASALLACVRTISGWTWGAYRVPAPSGWLLVAFYGLLAGTAVVAVARRKRWALMLALPLAVLVVLGATHPFAPRLTRGALEVTVLDVGQGDAIFVAFPDGRTLLTDGGGSYGASQVAGVRRGIDIGEQVVSTYLWQRGIKRLDVIALTHAHTDHLDGLNAVLENFAVGEVWIGRAVKTAPFRALAQHAKARGVPVVRRRRGDLFEWSGVTGIVLWPEDPSDAELASNNDSLVLRLAHGENVILLPGDIEKPVEQELAVRGDPLEAKVLKVGHHGSQTSTSQEFLALVAPRVAVVSVGETNPFGHPHAAPLERLAAAGVRVLRTDRDGAVTFSSDGRSVRVQSFAEQLHPR
jgi:competence protein ComEC